MSLKRWTALLCIMSVAAYAQPSPYFPRNGVKSENQIIQEINNPVAYLVIAAAPGVEDLASIANFRIGNGASVTVAYVTNGEDIPSDLNGEMFYQLASRRKEEAYYALSYLGAQAYFLNIPYGDFSAGITCFHPTAALTKALNDRLDSVMIQIKPDVIVLDRDPLSAGKESARLTYLEHLIVNRLRDKTTSSLWNGKRFFVQTNGRNNAAVVPVEQRDTVWSKSYDAIGREAEHFYESMRYQIPSWKGEGLHRYAQRYPLGMKPPMPMHRGLPDIGIKLQTLQGDVSAVNSIKKSSDREQQLAKLRNVIAQVDAFIDGPGKSIAPTDMRVLTTWKLGLEKLRCQILGVAIPYSVSDTVVTPIQVFFLRFGALDSVLRAGKNHILFPGVIQKQWIVNEAQNNFYDLKDSSQFRVLSPRSISLNSTETPQGFGAAQIRTSLFFIVQHEDPDPNRNFIDREEIPLVIAPFRSVEVLSPRAMMRGDTAVYVRFKSNVRDKTKGGVYINDAVVSSPQKEVDLPGKNVIVIDTLPLVWKDTLLTAPHEVKILAGKGIVVGSFMVRPVDVKINITSKVSICSTIENSPVQAALRRLGIAPALLDSTNCSYTELLKYSVIIVDQFSFDKFLGAAKQLDSVKQWLNSGGRFIIFPQYGAEPTNPFLGNGVAFTHLSAGDCHEKISIDSMNAISHLPNKISASSFTEEEFPISYSEIAETKGDHSTALINAADRLLLLEQRVGKGQIFYCAMNLFPRLLDLHAASYGLLANLISTGSE